MGIKMHDYIFVFLLIWSGVCYGGETNRIIGGAQEQDANDPKYQEMANELVHSYLNVRDQDKRNVTVIKVTTQVVSGIITKIKLRLFLVSGQSTTCDFSVREQQWKDVKHVTHKCDSLFIEKLSSRRFRPPKKYRETKNFNYLDLARLCLDSLFESRGRKPFKKTDVKEISVGKAKISIHAKINIILEINVITVKNEYKCTSLITEASRSLKNPAMIAKLTCKIANGEPENEPGGLETRNPKDPKYKELAIESFKKYQQTNKKKLKIIALVVKKVTVQVVSGVITRIEFIVVSTKGNKYACHSRITQQKWVNNKDIRVTCDRKKNPESTQKS
ncbi:uncharacterized protein LOC134673592 [Cydia fagiglandana]|uniref:uncharacterized protein LOC134673592 n=1 Tax=Cydia fagiglandana TaxID=1458189 RepID=UPI002FEE04C2